MQAVIFMGLQASGKSSFYKEWFFATHVRISLDLLRTRNRERRLMSMCLETQQPFVIDNTNPTREERAKYIDSAKSAKFCVVGYYFRSQITECIARNQQRSEPVPEIGILSTARKLELPTFEEGFDTLKYVRLTQAGFVVEEWNEAASDVLYR
ncbi:AAA family ATPase [Planctopirus hydrillae]|uniref:Kinase n=1 Tax=Planctopirus hydrillae TaxID=1841610 RepID=A0A1C3EKS5_9PLAN|nr:AAA family ATPase [Planctopirus hydrillae]ODA33830.1 kinase [Planctopirus hydrillae]